MMLQLILGIPDEGWANNGSAQTCPRNFRINFGIKIVSNMLITKIIFIFVQWICIRVTAKQRTLLEATNETIIQYLFNSQNCGFA